MSNTTLSSWNNEHFLIKLVGRLFILTAFTHWIQLFIYPTEMHIIGAALFGVIYFLIGFNIFRGSTKILWAGTVLPTIGAVLGGYRFWFLHRNPFSIFHISIDIIVVPLCIYILVNYRLVRNSRINQD